MIQFLKSYYKSIGALAFVLVLSFMSGEQIDKGPEFEIPHLDKLAHAGMYFILSWAFISDLRKRNKYSRAKTAGQAFVSALSVGVFTELVQHFFLQDRSGDFLDLLANLAGISAALLLFRISIKVSILRRMF